MKEQLRLIKNFKLVYKLQRQRKQTRSGHKRPYCTYASSAKEPVTYLWIAHRVAQAYVKGLSIDKTPQRKQVLILLVYNTFAVIHSYLLFKREDIRVKDQLRLV